MVEVVGIEQVDYVSRKTGKHVSGKILHLAEDLPPERGMGVKNLKSEFCRDGVLDGIDVGDRVIVYYDRYNNVAHVVLAG